MLWGNPAQRRVQRHLADGNAHTTGALVAQSEDAFAVAGHDTANVVVPWLGQHLVDEVPVWITDKQSPRLAPYFREALASFAHGGRVNDGQQLFRVVRDQRIEESLVIVLQVAHQCVSCKRVGLVLESPPASFALIFKCPDMRRQQAVKGKGVAFRLGKRGSLIESGMEKQIKARQVGADHRTVGGGGRTLFGHAVSPWKRAILRQNHLMALGVEHPRAILASAGSHSNATRRRSFKRR